jgi:ribose 5-phosphate isomerase A
LSWVESAKKGAALAALTHIENGMVIGLGSGSTAVYAIREIGNQLRNNTLRNIMGVPTSHQAEMEAINAGIPLTSLTEHPEIDIGLDGADQINETFQAIKGGGGALMREKVVASASKLYIIIIDTRKLSAELGKGIPLPIEVLPFALGHVVPQIESLGAKVNIRTGSGKLGPTLTDNGNFIIDTYFDVISNPKELNIELRKIPGVLDTGLFIDLVDIVYVGTNEGVKKLTSK